MEKSWLLVSWRIIFSLIFLSLRSLGIKALIKSGSHKFPTLPNTWGEDGDYYRDPNTNTMRQ